MRERQGFTLLEVMVSISILSFGLIFILQAFSRSLNAIRISQNNLQAGMVAEEKMAQLLINPQQTRSATAGNLGGKDKLEGFEFNWRLEWASADDYKDLNKTLSYIHWRQGKRKGGFSIITYLRTPIEDEEKKL